MDIATIIGWVAGVAIVLQATSGEWAGLYNGTAVLVVVGGGLAATLVAFPLREALGALGAVKNVLMVRPPESADMVERIVGYAEKARREGILSLEKPMADEPNMLTRAGIGLVVDGTEPDLIMDILETELHHVAERHAQRQRVVERTGRHWALFGGVGALLVLAQGGGVVGAVVPLLYGVLLYGLVGGAFARKLGEYHELEALAWKLVIEGVMAIQAGDNPRIIEHKLSVFLAPKDRPRGERKQVVAAPEKTPDIAPEEVERYLEEQRAAMLAAVREEVGKIAGDRGEKEAVEALVGRAEKGELGLMAVLGSLGPDLYANAMHTFNNPPPPLVRSAPEQLADFAGIAGLSDQATQSLMREIDQRDLVLALKGAVEPVREKFLGNMSERVQTFMSEEIGLVRCGPEQVLDAQVRILAQVYELVEQGTIEL